jgi:hypothetical protein
MLDPTFSVCYFCPTLSKTRKVPTIFIKSLNMKYHEDICSGRGPLMVAQWLRYCAINRKVADSVPDGVILEFLFDIILPIELWPWGRLSP